MGFLDRFKPAAPPTPDDLSNQAVLVYLDGQNLSDQVYETCDLVTLEDLLIPVLEASGAGEYDGDESASGETCLYFYGPDADRLFAAIQPILRSYPLCSGARVVLRFGQPGATQRELQLPVV